MSVSVRLAITNIIRKITDKTKQIQPATDKQIEFAEDMIQQIVKNFDDLIKYHEEGRDKLEALVKTAPEDEQEMLSDMISQIDERIKTLTDRRANSLVPAKNLISSLTGVPAKLFVIDFANSGNDETK